MSLRPRVEFRDLMSPRALWQLTLGDAVGQLPLLLLMIAFFLAGLLVLSLVRWLVGLLLRQFEPRRYTYVYYRDNAQTGKQIWAKLAPRRAANWIHLTTEILLLLFFALLVFFVLAIGNVNLWQSSFFLGILTGAILYVAAPILQLMAYGWLNLQTQPLAPGEYWERLGAPGHGGLVETYSLFLVWMRRIDAHGCWMPVRVSMTDAMTGTWVRNLERERDPRLRDSVSDAPPRGAELVDMSNQPRAYGGQAVSLLRHHVRAGKGEEIV